jgi:thiamine-monophosphate kinase
MSQTGNGCGQKMKLTEFDIIERYFAKPSAQRDDVTLGIGDDCAIVNIPAQHQLAITTDTLVEGVHFPAETSAYDIGYKALAVNLSDLAATGATPAWITLALTLPEANTEWLIEFSRGLFALASRYHIQLIGGDITHGPLTITIAAHGFVSRALTRRGAKPGDLIYVTNTLGDAALGLLFLNKKISLSTEFQEKVLAKLNRPEPQIETGIKLASLANAAIDISDGLAADLGHILEKSQVGAKIYVDQLPISDALRHAMPMEQAIATALTGGDDYELCFTVSPENIALLDTIPHLTCIGSITESFGLDLQFKNGNKYHGPSQGYQHF